MTAQTYDPKIFVSAGDATYEVLVIGGGLTITGHDVSFVSTTGITVATGSLTITGHDVEMLYGTTWTVDTGSLTITGHDVEFNTGYSVVVDVGALSITGHDVDFVRSLIDIMDTGGLTVTGHDVTFVYSGGADGILLSGDEQSGTDLIELSGDESGVLLVSYLADVITVDVTALTITGHEVTFGCTAALWLSGDEQSGTDELSLSGDAGPGSLMATNA